MATRYVLMSGNSDNSQVADDLSRELGIPVGFLGRPFYAKELDVFLGGLKTAAIVTQESGVSRFLSDYFGDKGIKHTPFANGHEFLNSGGGYDVVISDVGLPDISGPEIIRRHVAGKKGEQREV